MFLDRIDPRVHEALAISGLRVVFGHLGRRLTEYCGNRCRIASRFSEFRGERVPQSMKTEAGLHLSLGGKCAVRRKKEVQSAFGERRAARTDQDHPADPRGLIEDFTQPKMPFDPNGIARLGLPGLERNAVVARPGYPNDIALSKARIGGNGDGEANLP